MIYIKNQEELEKFEQRRALVGVYLDRVNDPSTIEWVLRTKNEFNRRAGRAWNLLIPAKDDSRYAYAPNALARPDDYSIEFASFLIDKFKIKPEATPGIVFRKSDKDFYYLKLGDERSSEEVILGIADLARKCRDLDGVDDPNRFRKHVNTEVVKYLRDRHKDPDSVPQDEHFFDILDLVRR